MTSRAPVEVEDDADIRATLVELLDQAGYVVSSANNGRTALERIGALGGDLWKLKFSIR